MQTCEMFATNQHEEVEHKTPPPDMNRTMLSPEGLLLNFRFGKFSRG